MLNAFFEKSKIDWAAIEWVGFDIDGTVYDEFEFIVQVYQEICSQLVPRNSVAYDFMLNRWLEKGSSYNKIFDEAYDQFIGGNDKAEFIQSALQIFRQFSPNLELNSRAQALLKFIGANYRTFIVTDGNAVLQRKKVKSLDVEGLLLPEVVIYTGLYKFSKPDRRVLPLLPKFVNSQNVVFLGDRDKDDRFAAEIGCQFIKVYNMIENG